MAAWYMLFFLVGGPGVGDWLAQIATEIDVSSYLLLDVLTAVDEIFACSFHWPIVNCSLDEHRN